MPHVVCQPCENHRYTDCVIVCPSEAFREGENMVYIDPDECIDCGACAAECPMEAIYPEEEVPEQWRHYIQLNAEMSKKCPKITEKKTPLCEQ